MNGAGVRDKLGARELLGIQEYQITVSPSANAFIGIQQRWRGGGAGKNKNGGKNNGGVPTK